MKIYSQLDIKWANLKLGNSGLTMKQAGCLLTNCAMVISDLTDKEHTPKMLLEWMNINDGFEESGDLRWGILTAYPPRKYDFHIIKIPMTDDETEYRMDAVWAGTIKHWILKDGDKWIDPLKGAYISKNYYAFQGDVRILSGKKLLTNPLMDKFNRIKEKFINKYNSPKTVPYMTKKDGKPIRCLIKQNDDGTFLEKQDIPVEEVIGALLPWD